MGGSATSSPAAPAGEGRLSLLAESLHTGWRKGTDGPLAMQVHRLISAMSPADWGEYVRWVDWCLGEVGYRPAGRPGGTSASAAGIPVPGRPGHVTGTCGCPLPEDEWEAGHRKCEGC
jgi:hypothetical protein